MLKLKKRYCKIKRTNGYCFEFITKKQIRVFWIWITIKTTNGWRG